MIEASLDKIDASTIQALVSNRVEECRTLDFKRELPGTADKDKHELRADATSFGNASGGDLIFGVAEDGSVATHVVGLQRIDTDAEIRRIESIIHSCVEPRLPGVESRAIEIPGCGHVIVVRVPKSWRGPHLVRRDDWFKMWGRTSKEKISFGSSEIRSAFALAEQLPERIRRWRDDRLATVLGGDAPVPLAPGGRLFMHLVPVSSFAGNVELSARELMEQVPKFGPPGTGSGHPRITIDGVVTTAAPSNHQGCPEYCQTFRSGRVEAVTTRIVRDADNQHIVSSVWYERMMITAMKSYLQGLQTLGVALPIAALFAAYGVKGAQLWVSPRLSGLGDSKFDRDMLILPDVLTETYAVDVPTLLRPVFDAVWNAAGWEQSPNYDENGKWRAHS